MDKASLALINLRLALLEQLLLSEPALKERYINALELLYFVVKEEDKEGSADMLAQMRDHLVEIKSIPTHSTRE